MFKHFIRPVSLAVVLLISLQLSAFADEIQGRVVQSNPDALVVTVYDAQGRPYPNSLSLRVDNYTQVVGVGSPLDLRPQDPIGAQIHQLETGEWHADRVTLFQDVNAQPATQKPSSGLRDLLGNPVARGALT